MMRTSLWRACMAAAVAAALAGCATPPEAGRATGTLYAFVVLGEQGAAVARVITSAGECPAVDFDGAAQSMVVRARPATVPLRPTRSAPSESRPSAFPVLTCDKAIPGSVARVTVAGRILPLPKADPQRIVVIGDTGCRMKTGDNIFQACNDPTLWPFATVADAAAATNPDLVIHVGDYHYRENACPVGNGGCAGSPWGYGWDAWEADLFAPAGNLLAAAPWIVVRGNHESCARAGQGWWRFLDPRPPAAGQNCDNASDDASGDYSAPYAVPLGTAATTDTQFIVFDSSLVGTTPLPANAAMHVKYRAQLERAFALGAGRPQTFFMNHHPILGFAPNPARPDAPFPGNAGLQSVLQAVQPTALFPANVAALLAGHVHLFEVVSFRAELPPQFISGNGGDWVDTDLPSPLPAGATPAPGAVVAGTVATNRFGFMTMARDGAGWTMTARDVRGAPLTTCTLFQRHATCTPATVP